METTEYIPTPQMAALVAKRKELRHERQSLREYILKLENKVQRITGKLEMVQEQMDELRWTENQDPNTLPGLEFDEGEDG